MPDESWGSALNKSSAIYKFDKKWSNWNILHEKIQSQSRSPQNSNKYIKSAWWHFHCLPCNESDVIVLCYIHAHLKSKLLQVSILLYLLDVTYCKTKLCTGKKIKAIHYFKDKYNMYRQTPHINWTCTCLGIWSAWMFTSMLVNRMGIRITKMIHRMYEIGGNWISWACSISPLGDLRKTVSKLKSPAVMEMIFSIAVAGGENGDRYKK